MNLHQLTQISIYFYDCTQWPNINWWHRNCG